jgi:enoyl-CoA hydratase/carnithine racemase
VNHVTEDFEGGIKKAIEIATKIGEKGPIAIRAAKKAVHFGIDMTLEKGLLLEDECY